MAAEHMNKSVTGGFALFLSLLALGGVGALGYFGFKADQQIKQLAANASSDTSSVKALVNEAQNTLNQITEIQAKHQEEKALLQGLKNQVIESQVKLARLNQDAPWVLSEVSYCLFLANERLRIAQDIPTAILQLETAQNKLEQLGDPGLLNTQAAIAKDIAQLKLLPPVDRQATWSMLEVINNTLPKLPFKNLSNTMPSELTKTSQHLENMPAWKKGLWDSWYQFKGIIKVTREDKNPVVPALDLQDKALIMHTMQMMIMQAQWAVLHADQKVYQANIDQLLVWIDHHIAQSPERDQVIKQLQGLRNQSIEAPQVNINNSLEALSQAMRQQSVKPSLPDLSKKQGQKATQP